MAEVNDERWHAPLIQTKMRPPRQTCKQLTRPAVIDRLRPALERKLTVVAAPAGFGKTTLLAEWCSTLLGESYAVAWLSLDKDDDDLQQFGAYVLGSFRQASGGIGRLAQELLKNDPLTPVKAVISVFLNEVSASDRNVILILDDFDRLSSIEIHEAVFRLLRYAPDNFHLVIAGRAEPAVALSYFFARGQLLRLDAEHLRFDAEEAQEFFSQIAGMELDRRNVSLLCDATEGWVAGLQLASLSLREEGDTSHVAQRLSKAKRSIDSYLTENVLIHVPERILDFLLRTSILDRLKPALCNAITGATDAWDILDWLEARNMFLKPLDEGREWYRYHALFSGYLRKRLARQSPDEVALLHRKASEWFAAMDLWPEAVKHALAAGDVQRAAIWVENCAMILVERSDVRTVLSWVAKLPGEAIQSRIRLRLAQAWALALSLQAAEATKALNAIKADMERGVLSVDDVIRGELLAVSAAIAGLTDDSTSSLQLGRSALAMRPAEDTWVERVAHAAVIFGLIYESKFDEVQGLRKTEPAASVATEPVYATVYRQSMFGLNMLVEGKLQEAAQLFEEAQEQAESTVGRHSAAAVLPAGYLSAIHYEWNDLARVAEVLRDRSAIAIEACALGSLTRFCLTSARLVALKDDFDEAHRILEQGVAVARKRRWLRMLAACMGEAIRLYIRENRLLEAERAVRALKALMPAEPPVQRCSLTETWQSYRSAQCRLLIARGQAAAVVPMLRALRAEMQSAGMLYMATRTAVLLAVALERAGSRDEASSVLADALLFGQENGLVRAFLDEGADIQGLLVDFRQDSARFPEVKPWYVDDLLRAFRASAAVPVAEKSDGPSSETFAASKLSAREIEILDYIARGLSNKEIARALRVAPETIKWHLKNIFEKLNVSSRIQAVQSGLGLDLPVRGRVTGPASPEASQEARAPRR